MTTFLRTSGSRPWASMVGYSSLRLNSRTGLLSGPTRRGESASIHCFRLATADRPQSSLNGTMAFCGRHVGQRVSVHRTIFMIISTTKCRALIKIWAKCNKYLYMLCASKWSMALCSFARAAHYLTVFAMFLVCICSEFGSLWCAFWERNMQQPSSYTWNEKHLSTKQKPWGFPPKVFLRFDIWKMKKLRDRHKCKYCKFTVVIENSISTLLLLYLVFHRKYFLKVWRLTN